jgi:hypothetical protein
MGRILKAFISDVQPDDIMTYADLEWSEGKVYDALGFTLEGWKPPVFFAINTDSWTRMPIMTDRTMAGVDMPPQARGCISVRSTATGVNGSHVLSVSNRFFQNFGSNKYRLKLTEY